MITDEKIKRFWNGIDIIGKNECWNWKKSVDKFGYGKVKISGKMYLCHRLAFSSFYEIDYPDSSVNIMHSCDNPKCCNPFHLRQGTLKENMQDMIRKGRQSKNSKPNRHMTKESAECLRKEFLNGSSKLSLSRKYNISPQTVRQIIKNEIWKLPC